MCADTEGSVRFVKKERQKRLFGWMLTGSCLLMTVGCVFSDEVSPSDVPPEGASSSISSEVVVHASALEATEILVDGVKMEDVFLLESHWYGVSYQNEDSLNKLMMMKYSDKDSVTPQARNGARLRLVFAASEGTPEKMTVTQQGNTLQANTGIPYDIRDVELTEDDSGYSFDIDFGAFSMYYYLVSCRWSNGNAAEYAFALERLAE